VIVPRPFRKQFDAYAAAGFHATRMEHRRGAHVRVWFAEFKTPVILTANVSEPRALANNISAFRRLARSEGESAA
jgi:hypothetical protein